MANYWIADPGGRVLGPVSFEVLQDLVVHDRIQGIDRVSKDGRTWFTLAQFPDIAQVLAEHAPSEARCAREQELARALNADLARMQRQMPHEIFGLAPESRVEDYRDAFFRLVKRFYPDRLPVDADPELRRICEEIFSLLSRLMTFIEHRPAPVVARPPPAPADARLSHPPGSPPPRPPPERRAFTYRPSEFIYERRSDDRIAAQVKITSDNCRIFTQSKLVNLSTGGAFMPCSELVALGTSVALDFSFDEPQRTIRVAGKVVWWSAGEKGQPRGFGVRFLDLGQADQDFIDAYLRKSQGAR
jgi:uncharacterized protein (TIGR02266 family)